MSFLQTLAITQVMPGLYLSVCLLVTKSCLTIWDPMHCSPPGSSIHGILRVRRLEWVAMPSSRGSSRPRDHTVVSRIAGRFFTIWATRFVLPWMKCIHICNDRHAPLHNPPQIFSPPQVPLSVNFLHIWTCNMWAFGAFSWVWWPSKPTV